MPSESIPYYLETMTERFMRSGSIDFDGSDLSRIASINDVFHVTADDGAAGLAETIDELGEAAGTIVVGPGTYTVDDNLEIPSNTELVGAGMFGETTIRLADDSDLSRAGIIRVLGDNVHLRGFDVDGNAANNTFTDFQEHGIYVDGADQITIEHVHVHDCPGYGIDPHADPDGVPTTNIIVTECLATDNGENGITFAGVVDGLLSSCIAANNDRHGINCTDTEGERHSITNCHAVGNTNGGFVIQNDTTNVRLSGCGAHDNGTDGYSIQGVDSIGLSNCSATENASTGFGIAGDGATDISLSNCQSQQNSVGLSITGLDGITVVGGLFSNNDEGIALGTTDGPAEQISIAGAQITNNSGYGINIQGGTQISLTGLQFDSNAVDSGNADITLQTPDGRASEHVSISNCQFRTTDATYGVDERDGSGPNIAQACTFEGSYSSSVNFSNTDSIESSNLG